MTDLQIQSQLTKLKNLDIRCGTCENVFRLKEGDMVVIYGITNRYNVNCIKCNTLIDFVWVSFPKH